MRLPAVYGKNTCPHGVCARGAHTALWSHSNTRRCARKGSAQVGQYRGTGRRYELPQHGFRILQKNTWGGGSGIGCLAQRNPVLQTRKSRVVNVLYVFPERLLSFLGPLLLPKESHPRGVVTVTDQPEAGAARSDGTCEQNDAAHAQRYAPRRLEFGESFGKCITDPGRY